MTEIPAPYTTTGDPGDEHPNWPAGKPVEVSTAASYRFQIPAGPEHTARSMRPTEAEKDAAIRRFADPRPRYLEGYDAYHEWRLACDALLDLAARLLGGRGK